MPAESRTNRHCVLVVAPAGIWRDALVSLLRAQPNLEVCHVVGEFGAARTLIAGAELTTVFAEYGADENALLSFIAWLHEDYPAVRCIVAVDTPLQKAHCLAAGAHLTLSKGWLDEGVLQHAVTI